MRACGRARCVVPFRFLPSSDEYRRVAAAVLHQMCGCSRRGCVLACSFVSLVVLFAVCRRSLVRSRLQRRALTLKRRALSARCCGSPTRRGCRFPFHIVGARWSHFPRARSFVSFISRATSLVCRSVLLPPEQQPIVAFLAAHPHSQTPSPAQPARRPAWSTSPSIRSAS